MAFEVVPTAAGRLHSDQYTKIIIINTPINLQAVLPCMDESSPAHTPLLILGYSGEEFSENRFMQISRAPNSYRIKTLQ